MMIFQLTIAAAPGTMLGRIECAKQSPSFDILIEDHAEANDRIIQVGKPAKSQTIVCRMENRTSSSARERK
ncbi:MAG: hypothetical protein MZV70_30235 [Desulfobacterales bacterium]|nr:hypothetical protein [Desulfobacterales bacterium]